MGEALIQEQNNQAAEPELHEANGMFYAHQKNAFGAGPTKEAALADLEIGKALLEEHHTAEQPSPTNNPPSTETGS